MIRTQFSIRFSANELDSFHKLGLVFCQTKTRDEFEAEVARWANSLAEERPELLKKVAIALMEVKCAQVQTR